MSEGMGRREFLKMAAGTAAAEVIPDFAEAREVGNEREKAREKEINKALEDIYEFAIENGLIEQTPDRAFAGPHSDLEARIEAAEEVLQNYEGTLSKLGEELFDWKGKSESHDYARVLSNDIANLKHAAEKVFTLHDELRTSNGKEPVSNELRESNEMFQLLFDSKFQGETQFKVAEELGEKLALFIPEAEKAVQEVSRMVGADPAIRLKAKDFHSFPFRNGNIQLAEVLIKISEGISIWINSELTTLIEKITFMSRSGVSTMQAEAKEQMVGDLEMYTNAMRQLTPPIQELAVPLDLHPNVGLDVDLIPKLNELRSLLTGRRT